ncbi:MAG: hypothetical protein IT431_08795 [Phycisphaerales bacterium]|nr:hypothetical protein [Phycisphaerales bacterium]
MTGAPTQPSAPAAPPRPLPDTPDAIGAWLDRLARLSRLPGAETAELREELDAHLRERVRDLMLAGTDEPEAIHKSISELGDLALLAQRYREASRTPRRRLTMQIALVAATTTALGLSTIALQQAQPQAEAPLPQNGEIRLQLVPKDVGPDGQGTYELAVSPDGVASDGVFSLGLVPDSVDETGQGTFRLELQPVPGDAPQLLRDIPIVGQLFSASPAPTTATIQEDIDGEARLVEVLQVVAISQNLRPYIHWRDLQVEPDTTVTDLPLGGQPLNSAIEMLNDALELDGGATLTYRVRDGLFEVASREYFDLRERELVTYEVGELVYADGPLQTTEESEVLTQLIQQIVEEQVWSSNGGSVGSIFCVGGKLFVNAPPRVHEQVAWLLAQLQDGEAAGQAVDDGSRTVQVIPLQHTVASTLRQRVAEAVEGLGGEVAADERMNALLVVGDERVTAVAESVIGALDQEAER